MTKIQATIKSPKLILCSDGWRISYCSGAMREWMKSNNIDYKIYINLFGPDREQVVILKDEDATLFQLRWA